jgi:hypothetical protein
MPLDFARARLLLSAGDLTRLFINELGWDNHRAVLEISVAGTAYQLRALAHKRALVAWVFHTPFDQALPDYAERRKIEHQVAKSAREHLIVFIDASGDTQIWQWVKRELGKPAACREHLYHRSQSGDALLQKLERLAVSLDEEDQIALSDVTSRVRAAFDVERVTKRFYERFQKEHSAFLAFVTGIKESADHEWYASVMLNRLMFVYFIQRKGFLDGDRDYLRHRLEAMRTEHGKDKFYSFYRYFLLRLFHEGLGGRERSAQLEKLVGRIPYLNGGLFDVHELERPDRYGKTIQIPDHAFERVFTYFDEYQWNLDDRPLRADNEINPDVLGYIFEKYINQKQMGAYYTREDVTEYISKSTLLPFLVDTARAGCSIAFENPAGATVWDRLKVEPDRYIYSAVRHGADETLPAGIVRGLGPRTLDQPVVNGEVLTVALRNGWNDPAPPTHALPTEIWREVIARRARYEAIKAKLAAGQVRDINDLVTLNLDIRQFVQDLIEGAEGPELLRAFWRGIEKVSVLDPTCGSGAFLFAALNILEPLYEACLDRMEAFVGDYDRSVENPRAEKYRDFREVLRNVAAHPNRRYFVFKSIILNNLYGVDIMEEAVEICKLRLFLKLAAQVEPNAARDNLGIEPLPDIDFNIRAGNTLVGYAKYDDVAFPATGTLDFDNAKERIGVRAADLQQLFDSFRARQIEGDGSVLTEDKQELRRRLKILDDELDHLLASEYDISPSKKALYAEWMRTHQPFHWFVEFYGIVHERGGFDVIIGNPPYVVYTPAKVAYLVQQDLFSTFSAKNLYALVCERSFRLSHASSAVGLIVQLSALSAEKMRPLQDLLLGRGLLVASSFPRRPESVFDGVEMPVTILISRSQSARPATSRVCRFYTEERPAALGVMPFARHSVRLQSHRIAKLGTELEVRVFGKLDSATVAMESLTTATSQHTLYYQEACRYWVKACKGQPFFRRNGERMSPPHGRNVAFQDSVACAFASCVVNSSLFYWFYSCFSDCEHINDSLLKAFKVPQTWRSENWVALERRLASSITENAHRKTITTKQGHKIEYDEINASRSKAIIDDIDRLLARHYGLTEEELDAIINYDIKYRMGRDADDEDE